MGQLPSIKSLGMEDFQSQKNWIGKLIDPLNSFMSSLVTNLNKGLTINENMMGFTKSFDVMGGGFPIYIPNDLKSKPIAITIGNIYIKATPAETIGTAATLEWEYAGSQLKIKNITGLTNNIKYTVTVVVFGG